MSREERRQYERMMRNMERGPALPPAARARAERKAARRAARGGGPRTYAFTTRWIVMSALIAAAVGYIGFSVQWPQAHAPFTGVILGLITLAALVGVRLLQRRAASRNG